MLELACKGRLWRGGFGVSGFRSLGVLSPETSVDDFHRFSLGKDHVSHLAEEVVTVSRCLVFDRFGSALEQADALLEGWLL